VVVAARRTPIATTGGRLSRVTAEQLAAHAIGASVEDAARATDAKPVVGDVVLGNCMGPGGNTARLAVLAAGLETTVPGMTIDRQCGSGLASIVASAQAIRAGDERMQIAGGVESASTAPTRSVDGVAYARAPFAPDGFPDPEMGPAAQNLAELHGIGRGKQDEYAARSHRLALDAQLAGRFDEELVAVDGVSADDGPRVGMPAMLGRFPLLFPGIGGASPGTLTAGNSCRISDGAAAVALVPKARRGSAPGLAIVATATIGCDPALPGIGPVAAVNQALADAGISLDDVAAFEIVEAFAAQTLAVLLQLDLMRNGVVDRRVCSDGGALALGHPWGASGAVSVVRLFSRLVRAGAPAGSFGVATAAIGGGMGVAAVFEVVR
jgi:acetyl-CoA C-acetyltransferase